MNFFRGSLVFACLSLSACAYPIINRQREVEVKHIVAVVECELRAVSKLFPAEANSKVADVWDIGSTLDLTLVSRVDADGKVSWVIPVDYSLTPSIGGHVQDTITAHLAFSTDLSVVLSTPPPEWCKPDDIDPSGTGIGLAAWVETVFSAIKAGNNGGLTYTKVLELQANAGARFGYIFAPINLDVGASVQGTKTNQLVVGIAPHAGPQKVIIVGDTTHRAGVASRVTTVTPGTSAARTFSNPNLNILLQRQAPVRFSPGQTIR
jgi:hypothetical protein